MRRGSQLGHASTDGEDTAVNQGASKLDNTIRLWPIPVVFDGVKPERMLLMSHQTRDAPAALESRCGGAGMSAADTTGRRGSSLYYDADTPSPTSTPNRRPQKLDGDSALRGRPLVGPKWRRLSLRDCGPAADRALYRAKAVGDDQPPTRLQGAAEGRDENT